ncbi:hypothetical protein CONPUDRAFT_44408 [Coniophora puteana RWD-64-598 SS2]|uniref:Nucleolar 27S pre-rRNA processing Urb2/Npa2 C-terminal domain-containing protein n=1 Tax=Coniophora puteana (strain RWD-64-598) TaxID=741705 RepID=A0A5M3N532_CONPW|nr:uncharacterized protein CONPUDRAFT_44408 [Coniophora puteana RWD-64-598 SS2]EIW86519.1 hypothetical protein CONPUDRAFT_44408 [Coniophora puteana RWD-64-598 SS2]
MTVPTSFTSSQEFVRTLKGASDPPQPGGLHKIEIARQAWDNTSFHVPNKGEVIADWIVTTFSKEKSANAHVRPLADIRFWALLQDILIHTPASERPWLSPLMNRTSLAPILRTFLSLLCELGLSTGRPLCYAVKSCLRVLWPISSQRFPIEMLLECFDTSIQVTSGFQEVEECLYLCDLITSSYRHALTNSSNKKKIYAAFMQAHFRGWVQLAGTLTRGSINSAHQALLADIYAAGVETIFNLDVLRHMKEASWDDAFVQSLRTALVSSPDKILPVLPMLFTSFTQSVRRHRSALFSQSDPIHSAATAVYLAFGSMMDPLTESELLWKTRAELLAIADKEGLVTVPNEGLHLYLVGTRDTAIAALSWKGDAHAFSPHALVFLACLAQVDYDLVDNALQPILPRLIHIPPNSPFVFKLWDLVVEHHSKTRTISSLIANILTATKDQYLFRLTDPMMNYQLCSTGSVFSSFHLERLSKSIRIFLTPSQCSSSTSALINSLKQNWADFNEADASLTASSTGEGKRKKRRKSAAGGTDHSDDVENRAVALSLTSKLIASYVSALPLRSLIEEDRAAILSELEEAFKFVCAACDVLIQALQSTKRTDTWAAQIVLSSGLRLTYSMKRMHTLGLHREVNLTTQLERLVSLIDDTETLPELTIEIFRNLLAESATSHAPVVLDKCLAYIDQNLRPQTAKWSGAVCHLVAQPIGGEAASVALLNVLLDRWLYLLDEIASEEQAIRLIQALFHLLPHVEVDRQGLRDLNSGRIFSTLMHSAKFWELQNLQCNFGLPLKHFFLLTITPAATLTLKIEPGQVLDACSAYTVLLYSPPEYITRSMRSIVCLRVPTIDGALELMKRKGADVDDQFTVLREFSVRICKHTGLIDPSVSCC